MMATAPLLQALGIATVALVCSTACAAGRSAAALITIPDRDGDHAISRDEFVQAVRDAPFLRIDTGGNGTVDWDEWQRFDTSPKARQHFEALDTDRDEQVSPGEWDYALGGSGVVVDLFEHLDANHDDVLLPEELDEGPVAPIFSIRF